MVFKIAQQFYFLSYLPGFKYYFQCESTQLTELPVLLAIMNLHCQTVISPNLISLDYHSTYAVSSFILNIHYFMWLSKWT